MTSTLLTSGAIWFGTAVCGALLTTPADPISGMLAFALAFVLFLIGFAWGLHWPLTLRWALTILGSLLAGSIAATIWRSVDFHLVFFALIFLPANIILGTKTAQASRAH
jgi:hypothetical protein